MIAFFVSGPVAALAPDSAVVEVGGIGTAVQCSPNTLSGLRMGTADQARHLPRRARGLPDAVRLRGRRRARTFELLQTASGVGPRLAQATPATHSPDALRRAIATGDEKTLTAVPGIGKRGAQKLLLELRTGSASPSARAPASAPRSAPAGATNCTPR